MLKKLFSITYMILAFKSKNALAATDKLVDSAVYFNSEAICAVFLLILIMTIYVRVKDEKSKQYREVKRK